MSQAIWGETTTGRWEKALVMAENVLVLRTDNLHQLAGTRWPWSWKSWEQLTLPHMLLLRHLSHKSQPSLTPDLPSDLNHTPLRLHLFLSLCSRWTDGNEDSGTKVKWHCWFLLWSHSSFILNPNLRGFVFKIFFSSWRIHWRPSLISFQQFPFFF